MIHFIYAIVVVLPTLLLPLGARLGWRWIRVRRLRILHLGLMAVVLAETALKIPCPLTALERRLRGEAANTQGFLEYWIHRSMFFDVSASTFDLLYLLFFAFMLALWFLIPPVQPRRAPAR